MKHWGLAAWWGIGVVGIAACGGGTSGVSSGGGGAGFTRSEQSYCDAREARSKRCNPDSGIAQPTFNRASCAEDHTCAVALLAFPDVYFDCRSNPDCAASSGDDTCNGRAAQGRSVPQSDLCAKKAAECKVAGGKTFDDDTCGVLAALNDPTLQKVYACIEKSCEQVSECIKSTVKAISPACD